MTESIPLLSPLPFAEYSPESFRDYVKSLYFKRPPRKTAKKKKGHPGVSSRLSKKGTLTLTTRRKPKYVTPEERIALEGKYPANVVFLTLRRLEFQIMEHATADALMAELKELEEVMSGGTL